MWRNGARRSCETEYENASSSLLLRSSSALSWARSSALPQDDADDGVAQLGGGLDLAGPPGRRPEPDGLLPRLERLPRVDPPAAARPRPASSGSPPQVDRPDQLGPEPEEVAPVDLRGRDRQQAAGGVLDRLGVGEVRGQRVGREDVVAPFALEPVGELADLAPRRASGRAGRSGRRGGSPPPGRRPVRAGRPRGGRARRRSRPPRSSRPAAGPGPTCGRSAARTRRAGAWRRSGATGPGRGSRRPSGPRRGPAWGVEWWQEIRPQSSPSTRIEIDIEAGVPMLAMYSTWTGETLRSVAKPRSSGRPVLGLAAGSIGTGR